MELYLCSDRVALAVPLASVRGRSVSYCIFPYAAYGDGGEYIKCSANEPRSAQKHPAS